jgi:hypothetical protein
MSGSVRLRTDATNHSRVRFTNGLTGRALDTLTPTRGSLGAPPPAGRPAMCSHPALVVVGIDLAGSPRRPTGVCVLRGLRAETHLAFSDEDILDLVRQARPALVPIDAPLSLPRGRRTSHRSGGVSLRACERALLQQGIRFFPITLGPMRMLTVRGLLLKKRLRTMGCRPVECFPGAAQDVWGLPRQHTDRRGLLAGLRKLGVKGLKQSATGDELDATTAALVGRWFLLNRASLLGGKNGVLLPAPHSRGRGRRRGQDRLCSGIRGPGWEGKNREAARKC